MKYSEQQIAELEEKRDFLDEQAGAMRFANKQFAAIEEVQRVLYSCKLSQTAVEALSVLVEIAEQSLVNGVAVWNKLV